MASSFKSFSTAFFIWMVNAKTNRLQFTVVVHQECSERPLGCCINCRASKVTVTRFLVRPAPAHGLPVYRLRTVLPYSLLIVTYEEPFSAGDLIATAKAADAPGLPGKHTCALVDLRAVDLSNLTAADSRRFATTRRDKIGPGPSEPVAFLIGRSEDFGTMRMNNQWLEAMGLRAERDTIVTQSMDEALHWLEERTGQPGLVEAIMLHFRAG